MAPTGKGRAQKEKRDYVGKVPKQEGGSDPNPLLSEKLSSAHGWNGISRRPSTRQISKTTL